MNKWLIATLSAFALCACKQHPAEPAADVTAKAAALESGVERSNFDTAVRPQDDLFQAVNGQWLTRTEIPADKSNYGSFTKLADDAEAQLHSIIDELVASKDRPAGSVAQKVGDFHASYMDEAAIEALGVKPVEALLARIDAVQSKADLIPLMAHLVRIGFNVPVFPYVHQDPKDSTQYVGDFWQAGLSLPDRDYYLIEDEKFAGIRSAYLAHLQKMYTLAGLPQPADSAAKILALETRIAEAQWDKVANRDPVKTYNSYAPDDLDQQFPGMDWKAYIQAVGFGEQPQILISQPSYVAAFAQLLQDTPLETWKTYFSWQVLTRSAPALSKDLVDEDFAFFSATLNGVPQQRPRWKRGVSAVEAAMGEAVGELYVQRHFPPENKARMEALVQNLIKSYALAIDQLEWMGEDTRKAAQDKLAKFTYKIGYPDEWRDYSALDIVAGDLVGNIQRAAAFEYDRNVAKLGGPIDRNEWGMTPQTVNAYYNPEKNEIVFPAAILQPPFFNMTAEDAVNYGGIGAVIGHEISHGFDDQGSQYDGDGNLRMWWTDEDRANFEARAARLAAQYDSYEPLPGYHVNGKFTLGENIADLGGLTIAYQAYLLSLDGAEPPVIDGMTAEQRLLSGWAQVWRREYREENLLNRLKTDPHSPSKYRVNGTVVNIPAFYKAYDVKPGDALYVAPEDRIKIW